jgi:hypothetical protein
LRPPPGIKLFCSADQRLKFFFGEPNFLGLDKKFRGCCSVAHPQKERAAVSERDEDGLDFFGFLPAHQFFERFMPRRPGTPARTQRTEQHLIKKFRLPIVRVGSLTMVDVSGAAQRLRSLVPDEQPRRPGRPKGSRDRNWGLK